MSVEFPQQEVGTVLKVPDTVLTGGKDEHANTIMEVTDYDSGHFGGKPGFGLKFVKLGANGGPGNTRYRRLHAMKGPCALRRPRQARRQRDTRQVWWPLWSR